MNYLQTIILSTVEGITEFLPISSTGHLILTANLLQISQTEFIKSFEIIIQLGAILAVITLYWKTLSQNILLWKKILLAFIPTGILGIIFYRLIKGFLLGNTVIVLISLFLGGIILILLEKIYKKQKFPIESFDNLSYKNALFIGLFQSISMMPGISRSAATIVGGLFLGLNRKTAVEFSFLLAIPTLLAATGLDLVKNNFNFTFYEYSLLFIGFAGAFITAFITIKIFLHIVQNHTFIFFGIYRIILAVTYWIFLIK